MVERSLGVRETPGSIPGSPNPAPRRRPAAAAGGSPRILFLDSHHPSGHSAAAEALRAQLRELRPDVRTRRLDLSRLHPVFGPIVSRAYFEIVQRTPKLWDYLYDNEAIADALREFRRVLSLPQRRKLRERLAAERPDIVVCTHALPCATLAVEKEQGALPVPLVGVLTDFGVHAYWLSRQVDLYLAPTREARLALQRRGIPAERIRVTGIPIHPRFEHPPGRARARRSLGLAPDRPTALVAGGTKGMGPLRDVVSALLSLEGVQVLVACGDNRELFRRLKSRARDASARGGRLVALPFTDDMPSCLAAADVLVGKPGGMTSSEAMASGTPMIILAPLPGQEERNSRYLAARGAARRVEDQAELLGAARAILLSPETARRMRRAALRLGRPDSALAACREILSLL